MVWEKVLSYQPSYSLSQAEQLNGSGELFLQKYPKLRVRLVDGSGLATAVVLNSIPSDTKQVLFCGGSSKVAHATITALCKRRVQVPISLLHCWFRSVAPLLL